MKKRYKLLKDWSGQKAGTIIEMNAADAASMVETKWMEEFNDSTTTDDPAQEALDNLLENFRKGLEGVIGETADKILKAAGAGKGNGRGTKIAGGQPRNDDDEKYGYKNLGEFALDVKIVSKSTNKTPERIAAVIEKAPTGMFENSGTDGGILIPTQLASTIYERAFPENNLVMKTDGYTLTGNSMEFPGLIDDNRATGQRWGGITGYWLDEAQQKTNSRPKFTNIKLRLHKLAVMVYVTDELLQDSPLALDQFISKKAGDEINFLSSDALINGGGGVKPLGILNSPSLIAVNRATSNKIQFADVITMWNRMWAPSRANSVWLCNQEIEPQLDQLTFLVKNVAGSENVGGWPIYLPGGAFGNISGSPYGTLKGRPVMPIEWCPALGSLGDLMLVDLSQYITATKGGIQAAMSIHLRFDYDETAFRFVYRIDGQPWWNKPVTPFKGTSGNKYSPFVALDVPA